MSELKVYGGLKPHDGRQVRSIVAARNQKEAAAAAHETLSGFRRYWMETFSTGGRELALSAPGALFFYDAPRGREYSDGYDWKRYSEEQPI